MLNGLDNQKLVSSMKGALSVEALRSMVVANEQVSEHLGNARIVSRSIILLSPLRDRPS
jgi:hypothetical protein